MTIWLQGEGPAVNRKRVRRLMRLMGLEAVYPKPNLSAGGQGHKIYPYQLRGVTIGRVGQVWSTDITYVPLASGFMYLAAVIDWFSRYVIAWRLSNTLNGTFCLELMRGGADDRVGNPSSAGGGRCRGPPGKRGAARRIRFSRSFSRRWGSPLKTGKVKVLPPQDRTAPAPRADDVRASNRAAPSLCLPLYVFVLVGQRHFSHWARPKSSWAK